MVKKLVDIVSLTLFQYCYNVIINLFHLKQDTCLCYLYQDYCLEEYFYEFEDLDACWTTNEYGKEALPNYCCVCVFVNEY